MNTFFQALLADISSLPWIPIVAIIGGLCISAIAIIGGLMTANRRQQLWHETARVALEKGQPLPTLPEDAQPEVKPRSHLADIRTGLILLAVGGGLFLFLDHLIDRNIAYVGAIPGFIGVALLLFGGLNAFAKRNDPPPSDRS